jgi:excisionase family DNA binding protein
VAQDLELTAIESPLGDGAALPDHAAMKDGGGFLLSPKALARFLGLQEHAVRTLVDRGDLKHVRVGRRIYVTRDQVADFIAANTHAGYVSRWQDR